MPITTTSFTSVNVGTSANDGTGDELRIAFQKVNSNFSNISTVGFNSGNILASGNVQAVYFVGDGSQLVNVSSSNAYANANVAAYLVAYNGIVTASNVFVAGNVTSQWFLGKANVSSIITTDLGASGMIYANAGVNSTSTGTGALVVNGGVGITGNLTVGNLTVLGTQTVVSATSVAVANSFIFLSNNNITNVLDIGFVGQYAAGQGNVYAGLVRRASDGVYRLFSNLNPVPSTTINVANITLATLQLGNILAGNVTGVINVAAQPYITSLGNLASLSSSGNITTTGYFFGNGSQLAGIVSYSNVYVATYLPTYSGNVANLTVTATLAGPTITAINSNVTVGNTNMKNYVDGQITAANSAITSANLGMKGYVDNSVSTANIAMKGYVDAVADRSIYGNSNVKSYLTQFDGNLISNGNIAYNIGTNVNQWASVYANVIYANSNIYIGGTDIKSYIDSVASLSIYSNVNTKAYTESMGFQNYGNVNVASYLSGNVTVGNISATYFTGNGSQLTGLPSGYSNVQVKSFLATGDGASRLIQGYYANIDLGATAQLFSFGATAKSYFGHDGTLGNTSINYIRADNGDVRISTNNAAKTWTFDNTGLLTFAGTLTNGAKFDGNDFTAAPNSFIEFAGYTANTYVGLDNNNVFIQTNWSTAGKQWTFANTGSIIFPDSTVQTTAYTGAGGSNYSNANVTAYTVTMGFTNYSNVNVSALITTNGLTNYSNVNVKAYAESMGYQNYGNVNVAAVITTNGLTNYSNVNTAAYLNSQGYNLYSNVNVVAYLAGNITAGNVSATYFTGNGSQLTGLPASYGNVQVASYLAGNVTVGNLTVSNLVVLGTQTIINATSVNISNSFVFLSNNNITNSVDIGFLGQYNAGQGNVYTGLAYRAADGIYRLFSNVSPQPSLTVNLANAVYSAIQVGNIIAANVTVNTVIGSNIYVNGNVIAGNAAIAGIVLTNNSIYSSQTAVDIQFGQLAATANIVMNRNTVHNRDLTVIGNVAANNISILGNILSTGASIFGNARLGLAGQVSGAFHTIIGNITQTSSGGAVYFNTTGNIIAGNIISSSATVNGIANVNMLNASGNLSVAGNTALYGNLTVGTVGAVAGVFHTVVGNITQITSGGAVGFNTTGNISASVANFGSGNVGGFAIGYRDLPQITAANLTLIAGDAGKHYYATNTSPTTLTIPLNSSVAFALGTAVSVVNQGTGNITIAKGSTTLYLAGNSTSANRTITSFGMATLVKVATDTWFINGTGLV